MSIDSRHAARPMTTNWKQHSIYLLVFLSRLILNQWSRNYSRGVEIPHHHYYSVDSFVRKHSHCKQVRMKTLTMGFLVEFPSTGRCVACLLYWSLSHISRLECLRFEGYSVPRDFDMFFFFIFHFMMLTTKKSEIFVSVSCQVCHFYCERTLSCPFPSVSRHWTAYKAFGDP